MSGLEFLRSTFFGGQGLRFCIKTLPMSFRSSNEDEKERTKEEIKERLSKEHTKRTCERFFKGYLRVELILYFHGRFENTDVDNVAKYTLDCMTGYAYKDDRQIKELFVKKIKCKRGANEYIGVGISRVNS